MKLAITGKGGTGKSTIAGIMAHFFNDEGFRVLAVDADPDANLASDIGLPLIDFMNDEVWREFHSVYASIVSNPPIS
jgi:CO dehydrogenase nickel-insertion accessory protein CooC1